jgi:hypothetical protein
VAGVLEGVTVFVGVKVGVTVGVTVDVGVNVGVTVGVIVGVTVEVGVKVGVTVGVIVGVTVEVGVALLPGVDDGVTVGVGEQKSISSIFLAFNFVTSSTFEMLTHKTSLTLLTVGIYSIYYTNSIHSCEGLKKISSVASA